MSAPEELELVTDFASLRAGDLVVVKDCAWCGGSHRALLVRLGRRPGMLADGSADLGPGWEMLPGDCPLGGYRGSVGRATVSERRAYRVVIPPAAETREVARPKTRERVK